MDLFLDIILVIASIVMLWKGADWLVESAAEIAHSLKISDLVIGLTVVAFGTSAPEFAVTIRAAITGQTDISGSETEGTAADTSTRTKSIKQKKEMKNA